MNSCSRKPKELQSSVFGSSTSLSEGTYLCLPHKKASKEYAKEDIWVISTSPYFTAMGGHKVFLARSLWHGPTRNGILEVFVTTSELIL